MVRPVGIDHLDLGDGRIPLFACEILLAEGNVGKVHRKPALVNESRQPLLIKLQKTLERLDHGRLWIVHPKRLARGKRGLASFHRIDYVVLDNLDIVVCQVAL